jgi:hypothetical protein
LPQEKGEIRVLNNGAGIPVEIHKEEGIYVPELIFGHLLTSSNYNDNEKKVTGGRNGYGAKLANIFSTRFVVETCDGKRKRRYKQVFSKNMTEKADPVITDCKPTDNWTAITFRPDLERFGMDSLDEDMGEGDCSLLPYVFVRSFLLSSTAACHLWAPILTQPPFSPPPCSLLPLFLTLNGSFPDAQAHLRRGWHPW